MQSCLQAFPLVPKRLEEIFVQEGGSEVKFVCIFVSVCVCMYLCMYTYLWVLVHICTPVCEDQRLTSGFFLIYFIHYIPETGSLTVLIKVTIAVMKHHSPSNLGREGFIWLILLFIIKGSQERNSNRVGI